jgi:hypothetical protein
VTELPIACSLDAPALEQRLAEIGALGREALIDAHGGVLRFRRSDAVRARLQAIIAAESGCCPFLTFALEDRADELVLRIEAPEGAETVADELAAAFSR